MKPRVPRAARGSRLAWTAWTAICVIWGTTYLAIKVALATVPPFLMGGFRYTCGGLILAALLRLGGHPLPRPSEWKTLAVLGVFMLLVGNGGVVWGEQYVSSGLAAVLIATSPFWMVSVDAMVTKGEQLHARQWTGLVIGFLGIVLLVWPDVVRGGGPDAAGRDGASSRASWRSSSRAPAGRWDRPTRGVHVMPPDVLGAAAIQMVFGGLYLLATGTAIGEWHVLSFTMRTALAVAISASRARSSRSRRTPSRCGISTSRSCRSTPT